MLRNTMESRDATDRQTMRALPTEPLEILRYALSEIEQGIRREGKVPSIVRVSQIVNEGITFLEAETARVKGPQSSCSQQDTLL